VKTEDRSLGNFTAISSYGPYNVYLTQDSGFKVSVEADDNLLPFIDTYVEGGELKIRTKEGYNLSESREISIHVSAPSFSALKSVGSGDIISQNKINNSTPVSFEATGSGDIKANLNAPEVKAEVLGSGNISLQGETKTFKGNITGSGNIRAFDLKSENSDIEILGSGNADVYASVKLSVEVNGSGDVNYKGSGQVASNIHGSGSVKKVD